jgi:hypothetical protein
MRGWIERRRLAQGVIAHLLVLAFLLPAFVGLVPKPALTAEQAFAAALAASRCTTDNGGHPSPAAPVEHDQSCVLCQTHCPAVPAGLDPVSKVAPRQRDADLIPWPASTRPHPAHWRLEGVPRGPPVPV